MLKYPAFRHTLLCICFFSM